MLGFHSPGTNFSYKHCFSSFYYVHITRKKAAETKFAQKICTFNVDEIDYRLVTKKLKFNSSVYLVLSDYSNCYTDFYCTGFGIKFGVTLLQPDIEQD